MHGWMNGGALPVDDEKLRRITRMSPKNWASQRDDIKVFFTTINGQFRQKRLDAELARWTENKERKSAAGRAAGLASAAKRHQAGGNGRSTTVEQTLNGRATVVQRESNPTSTPLPSEEISVASQPRRRLKAADQPHADLKPSVPCPYSDIVNLYHDKLPSLPRVRLMPDGRQKAMRKAWGWVLSSKKPDGTRRATNAAEASAWFDEYFERASANDFLLGRTARSAEHAGWQCDLDNLLTEKGMKQVIEKTEGAA